ncbi:hypothetical protein JW964_21220 [candidate division KSB1 bacterium]|nr:hypothetical protein [candidate division KSB1 bacterium]
MRTIFKSFDQFLSAFAWISAIWLALNLILIPFNWQDVFIDKQIVSGTEVFLLSGFISIFLFDLLAIFWSLINKSLHESAPKQKYYLLAGGILCLFFLAIVKVMADEVGRESRLLMGGMGEYIILNILLLIQIAYNIFFFLVLKRIKSRTN